MDHVQWINILYVISGVHVMLFNAFGEHQDIFMGHVQWINILYVISGVHVMLLRIVKRRIFMGHVQRINMSFLCLKVSLWVRSGYPMSLTQ